MAQIIRLVEPPDERAALDAVGVVEENQLLVLFRELQADREGPPDETFRPYLKHLPGQPNYAELKPRVKKPKIFGARLERLSEDINPSSTHGALDDTLLRKAFTFQLPPPPVLPTPILPARAVIGAPTNAPRRRGGQKQSGPAGSAPSRAAAANKKKRASAPTKRVPATAATGTERKKKKV